MAASTTRIQWRGSLEEAQAEAQAHQRPLLLMPCGQGLVDVSGDGGGL